MNLERKIAILADAAKYDASCASSGSIKRNSSKGRGVGSTSSGMGICHSYTPDGRCVSLLKILLTNFCIYECSYCVNRASSNVERARFSVEEIVKLTIDFYKRNYIEGLFLSSGIIRSSDYTMEQLVLVAKSLREQEDFRGYIHLKTIPDASPELLKMAGQYADRLSINVELPSRKSLARFAPEKNPATIRQAMSGLTERIDESKESRKRAQKIRSQPLSAGKTKTRSKKVLFSPAGQSTQMIIGADQSSDAKILRLSNNLYSSYKMKRVYYSAYSPIPDSTKNLPPIAPPLVREHRLYQADWLLRFYGFHVDEITANTREVRTPGLAVKKNSLLIPERQSSLDSKPQQGGMLDLDIDPKLAWAISNRTFFPVDINRAPKDVLIRVPGIGAIGASKIVQSRRFYRLRLEDLGKCGISVKKAGAFVTTSDRNPHTKLLEQVDLKQHFVRQESTQMSLF